MTEKCDIPGKRLVPVWVRDAKTGKEICWMMPEEIYAQIAPYMIDGTVLSLEIPEKDKETS